MRRAFSKPVVSAIADHSPSTSQLGRISQLQGRHQPGRPHSSARARTQGDTFHRRRPPSRHCRRDKSVIQVDQPQGCRQKGWSLPRKGLDCQIAGRDQGIESRGRRKILGLGGQGYQVVVLHRSTCCKRILSCLKYLVQEAQISCARGLQLSGTESSALTWVEQGAVY